MKCEICGKEILRDSQCINYKYYHNNCIENLQQENKQLKDELKNKPDTQITLQDDKGNKFMIIQTERIDMQVELNKTIEKLFNNWNKLKECIKECLEAIDTIQKLTGNAIENYTPRILTYRQILDKMQELEGSDK